MQIGIFQSDLSGLSKPERISRLAFILSTKQLDLIVCPELFMSGYNIGQQLQAQAEPRRADFSAQISQLAKSTHTAIIYGYPEQESDRLFNAALCVDSRGEIVANHRKLLLPPGFESIYFLAGNRMTIFDLNSVKCAILICYDAEYPESVRAAAETGVELLIVPTALFDNWGVVSKKVIPARAFENGIWVAYANHAGIEGGLQYYGGSCIINPIGEDVARAGADETLIQAKIQVNEVKNAQARLPYLQNYKHLRKVLSSAHYET